MKGVISVLLSRDKRTEVTLVESYRGLRIFQPVRRASNFPEEPRQDVVRDTHNAPQHALKRSANVRELALK